MKTEDLIERINRRLAQFRSELVGRSAINLQDLAVHSETFFAALLNLVYGWQLSNVNRDHPNHPGIDLIDSSRKLVLQVSVQSDRAKIAHSLTKVPATYNGWTFKYLSICHDVATPRKGSKKLPASVANFDFTTDIIDPSRLLRHINSLGLDQQVKICDYLDEQFQGEPQMIRPSNIGEIVHRLSLAKSPPSGTQLEGRPGRKVPTPYDIQKKIEYNRLVTAGREIQKKSLLFNAAQDVYDGLNRLGSHKGRSVHEKLCELYWELEPDFDPDDLFVELRSRVRRLVENSTELRGVATEELDYGIKILLIHAFMDCHVYKAPPTHEEADLATS